ncbi:MAG TPA: 16S rRNA (cytidine(1402)-2'-O)-methyltransferase [Pyrinomonadaceae bacterium]|nr:16S rRNA (cytidine(1402)-2'-O)-methyltransferase [Pyrinomonadaceae bacterium]
MSDETRAGGKGRLYVVATPIGNLEDITRRALRVLGEVDLVACEDTRRTRGLLEHFQLKTALLSYHEHNERARAEELIARLKRGQTIALVSDAGTPAISDPGFTLVRACVEAGIEVVPVPGASALVAALAASGLPTDEFYFGGFLPARAQARRARLAALRDIPATLVFYEAPHRIAHLLADAREVLGERRAAVARELTKMHEEFARGTLSELVERFAGEGAARGEFVLVVDREVIEAEGAGREVGAEGIAERVAAFEAEGLDQRAALKRAARELGMSRDEAYRRLVEERARKKS